MENGGEKDVVDPAGAYSLPPEQPVEGWHNFPPLGRGLVRAAGMGCYARFRNAGWVGDGGRPWMDGRS